MKWEEVEPEIFVGFSDRCYSCGEPHPRMPWSYQCGECFHAWTTAGDLQIHDHEQRGGMGRIRNVEDIHSCPCCAHDF